MTDVRDDLRARLNRILEGNIEEDDSDNISDNNSEDEEFDVEDIDEDIISETAIALMIEAAEEYALQIVKDFIMENSHKLVRDKVLTENSIGQSVFVLDSMSRRKKAENLLKLQMARKAKDPRYFKAIALRRAYRRLIQQIRQDPRYAAAHTQTMKMQFRAFVPDAKTMSQYRQNKRTRLTY